MGHVAHVFRKICFLLLKVLFHSSESEANMNYSMHQNQVPTPLGKVVLPSSNWYRFTLLSMHLDCQLLKKILLRLKTDDS